MQLISTSLTALIICISDNRIVTATNTHQAP